MRISDWSSDVCSSDLVVELAGNEYRFGRLQCAFGRRKEFVRAGRYAGTEISAGQIGVTGRKYWRLDKRCIDDGAGGKVRFAHGGLRIQSFRCVDRKSTRLNSSH